ncbi:uncharacterized protein LOC130758736 [Actinidia eriantha]|uniref:uncharacterized protein LOC130758736 n=1 Tax=Actinidia eriantha TaxID=165200 RepID=UPI00258D4EDD|nr:uncharacterized protein LOC130758736 [Actinidia eriantha]
MSDPFIQELPEAYQDFISYIVNVQADGHCGFRAIAAQLGYGEDNWAHVRMDLIEEIQTNMKLYNVLYREYNYANTLLHSLAWFTPTAPQAYWMDSMALGVVIASRYNLVLHMFDTYHSGYFTHLPLRSHLVPIKNRREIVIAHIRGNHFVQVFLRSHYPVPPTPLWWRQYVSIEARGWVESYIVRMNLWSEIKGGGSGCPWKRVWRRY